MIHQLELRPDRVPVWPVPARLTDYLAVRLLVERAVLSHVARERGTQLATLRGELAATLPPPRPRSTEERAFLLFHVAQLIGLDAMRIGRLSAEEVAEIERVVLTHREHDEQRWLHCAFELHLRKRFFDALTAHRPEPDAGHPASQAIFCVDEREESIRRHLEEFDDRMETMSTAGFFGVAMYHQGVRDARPRPLAPVAIRPTHFVPMERDEEGGVARGFAREIDRVRAQTLHVGSRSLVRGAIVSVIGAISLVPLVLRVLFPRRFADAVLPSRALGKIVIDRVDRVAPPLGERIGYSEDEMVTIVERVLGELGLVTGRFARLVIVVGHAADSLNNPHRSAYDCGACGGGPGGANARAFVAMANRASVRAKLADVASSFPRGRDSSPPSTTRPPIPSRGSTKRTSRLRMPTTSRARRARSPRRSSATPKNDAGDSCARGTIAPSGDDALDAVAKRRWDLAEPRPGYNHATNALSVIGRRSRTRGLFLDRRAFLVSYDPTHDDDGAILRGILAAVVPVIVGINLEYFFGAVDPEVYGAGSKLPHNVAALIGVQNGSGGDLRTGLCRAAVEIHEPVRVTMVVEATPERLASSSPRSEMLTRLVKNRWLFLAALSPDGSEVHDFASGSPRIHVGQRTLAVVPDAPRTGSAENAVTSTSWRSRRVDAMTTYERVLQVLLLLRSAARRCSSASSSSAPFRDDRSPNAPSPSRRASR